MTITKPDISFDQLLNKAPLGPSSDSVTIVGVLARSPHEGRFVVTVPNGQTFTLEVMAVKQHKVVAESVGQLLVELELDAKKLPPEVRATPQMPPSKSSRATLPDSPTLATLIRGPCLGALAKPDLLEGARFGGMLVPGFGGQVSLPTSPFVLAASHQAPAETTAALQSLLWFGPYHGLPKFRSDGTFIPGLDAPKLAPDDR